MIGKTEQIYELGEQPVTIGRADDCDIVLLEQAASRLHARLLPGPEGWTLVDEGSQAGVFVGGQRITRHVLQDGESFRVGATDLQLVLRPASQPTVIGATRPPAAARREDAIGHAATISAPEPHAHEAPAAAAAPLAAPIVAPATPHVRVPAPAPPPPAAVAPAPRAPAPAPPPPRAPAPPPASAPSFIDFGPVGRPAIEPSAPSFVDFGDVGRPQAPRASQSSFSGELADEPSRIEQRDESHGSRLGTWLVFIGVFAALTAGVVVLAYDVTWSDFVGIFE